MKKILTAFAFVLFVPGLAVAEDEEMSGDGIFGMKGGYVHPFVSVGAVYDNNIFNDTNKSGDYYTTLSPGLWLALPGSRERILNLATANVAPGGMQVGLDRPEIFKRYQAYALYQGDWQYYDTYTNEDREDHRAEGFFQYNLKGGLSLNLLDEYKKAYDPRSTGES